MSFKLMTVVNLLRKMLVANPAYRLTAREVRQHPWLRDIPPRTPIEEIATLAPSVKESGSVPESKTEAKDAVSLLHLADTLLIL